MNVTGIVRLDKCKEIFTQDAEVMNILATGKFGLVYGNMDSPESTNAYYAILLQGRRVKPVSDDFFLFEKYAEYTYDRDDLDEYEQEEIVNAIPGSEIPVTDFAEKPLTRMLYIDAMSLMLDGNGDFVVMYDKDSETLLIVQLD